MKKNIWISVFLVLSVVWQCRPEKADIYLIGDSTMANKAPAKKPETGWGQVFPEFFTENVSIHNHAVNGRSTKSFINEGKWEAVLDSLQPGNWVFIQFGHNDQKDYDTTRYTAPHGLYKSNLELYVKQTRSKGAKPVLLTPVMRRSFDKEGNFFDTHGDYPNVVREVADEMKVPLIDLHKSSRKLIGQFGEEKSKEIFLWVKSGEYSGYPNGKEDNTHFNQYGARLIACLVAHDLANLRVDLVEYLINPEQICY